MGWMDGNLDGRTYINLLCRLLPKNTSLDHTILEFRKANPATPLIPAASLKGAPAT